MGKKDEREEAGQPEEDGSNLATQEDQRADLEEEEPLPSER